MNPLLRIAKPCEEALEKMHEIPGGKFCDLCSKKVIDLSNLNDPEILNLLQHNKGKKFCGILLKHQLELPLLSENIQPSENYSRKMTFSKFAVGATLAISMANSYPAQTKSFTKTEITNGKSTISKQSKENETPEKVEDGNIKISGKVISDRTGNAIPQARVSFITIKKIYSTLTDSNGNYSLEVPAEIIKYENLLEFDGPKNSFSTKLIIVKKEDAFRKNTVKLLENGEFREYGEIFFIFPNEKSLVFLENKKLDYKLFNKSFSLYEDKYRLYYIPKPYSRVFTNDENINDIFITFIR